MNIVKLKMMMFVVKNESRIFSYDDRKTESYYSMLNEITTIEIKEEITKIGYYSMKGLSKVTEIIINKTIERIGMNVFEDCISLIAINVNSENEYLISHYSSQCPFILQDGNYRI